MDKHNKVKNVSIVFIPDYLVKTLESRNITLDILDKYISNFDINNINVINKILTDNIAIYDLHDLIDFNIMLNNKLLNSSNNNYVTNDLLLHSNYIITDANTNHDLIELYHDPKIDVRSIIVSRNNIALDTVCNMAHTDNTVFIILRNGFTNFMIYNIKGFKEIFLANVVDFIHKVYGEDVLNNSTIFNTYIRACLHATVEQTV